MHNTTLIYHLPFLRSHKNKHKNIFKVSLIKVEKFNLDAWYEPVCESGMPTVVFRIPHVLLQ